MKYLVKHSIVLNSRTNINKYDIAQSRAWDVWDFCGLTGPRATSLGEALSREPKQCIQIGAARGLGFRAVFGLGFRV